MFSGGFGMVFRRRDGILIDAAIARIRGVPAREKYGHKGQYMDWSQGYFTELGYTFGYYRELSHAMLRLACLCRGVETGFGDAPNYLELGSGQGVSVNIHAAGSSGSYWGCDFNPAQTVESRKLAEASGADVELLDDSFEEVIEGHRALPRLFYPEQYLLE